MLTPDGLPQRLDWFDLLLLYGLRFLTTLNTGNTGNTSIPYNL
jgi:hypothetical protein